QYKKTGIDVSNDNRTLGKLNCQARDLPAPLDLSQPPFDISPPPLELSPPPLDFSPPSRDLSPLSPCPSPPLDIWPPPLDVSPPPLACHHISGPRHRVWSPWPPLTVRRCVSNPCHRLSTSRSWAQHLLLIAQALANAIIPFDDSVSDPQKKLRGAGRETISLSAPPALLWQGGWFRGIRLGIMRELEVS
ncbi:hypothetical protein FRC01_012827, partial [Tulasnella sp. 417]